MKGPEENKRSDQLDSNAEELVKDAIQRGRKRRSSSRNVSNGEITLRSTPKVDPTSLIKPNKLTHKPSYHKQRKNTLIPQQDESDDESNDEWEEHVDVDHETMKAAVKFAEQEGRKQDAQSNKKSQHKSDKGDAPEEPEITEEERDKLEKENKSKQRRALIKLYMKIKRKHTCHIVISLASMLRMDDAANDDNVKAIALSITPDDTLLQPKAFAECLARFGFWLRVQFQISALEYPLNGKRDYMKIKRPCNVSERVINIAHTSIGEILDMAVFTAAIIRAQGYRCRIVHALQFIPFQPPKFSRSQMHQKMMGNTQVVLTHTGDTSECLHFAWVEVWSPEAKRWIPLDLYGGTKCEGFPPETLSESMKIIPRFDPLKKEKEKDQEEKEEEEEKPKKQNLRRRSARQKPKKIEKPKPTAERKLSPAMYAHVVAVENGFLTDVTRRYVLNWSDIEKVRTKWKSLETAIENLGHELPKDVQDEAIKSEMAEFDALAADEEIPTTISGVQKNPRYVMERHIKRYETIFPKEPIIGYIREEAIYLSSHVRLLHTKDRWIRVMRKVMDGAKPMKSVRSKNGTDSEVALFGEWQTEPLIIPPVEDGKVPRGPHGNVDLWTEDHMPKGGVHVNMPHARVAARKLGIDFAPAMTGFDIRGGRSIPKIEGVVVAEENEVVVREAAAEAARAAFERQEKRLQEEACQKWLKLLRAIKARQKVSQKYGGLLEDGTTYEAQQKKLGMKRARAEKDGKLNGESVTTGKSGSSSKRRKITLTETHQHDFDEPRCIEGNSWVKTCKICDLDLTFEQL